MCAAAGPRCCCCLLLARRPRYPLRAGLTQASPARQGPCLLLRPRSGQLECFRASMTCWPKALPYRNHCCCCYCHTRNRCYCCYSHTRNHCYCCYFHGTCNHMPGTSGYCRYCRGTHKATPRSCCYCRYCRGTHKAMSCGSWFRRRRPACRPALTQASSTSRGACLPLPPPPLGSGCSRSSTTSCWPKDATRL